MLRVDEAALGGSDVEGAEEAAVGLDGRVDQALHHGVDVGLGVGEVGVDAALGLGRSAVEIDEDLVAVDADVDVDVDGLGVDAVVVDVVDEVPLALRQGGNLGAGQGLGGVEDVGHVGLHLLEAVLVDEAEEVALTEADGGEKGLDVAENLVGDADVLLEDAPDGAVELAFVVELEGREDQALLEYLGVVAGVATGDAAADVGLVADAAGPADEDIVHEDGLEEEDVGQVAGALVGVVIGKDVAGLHVVAEGVHHALEGRGHAAEVRREGEALGDLLALGVEEGGGEVHAVLDDGGAGGADHGEGHGVGGAHEGVLDDFTSYGIGGLQHGALLPLGRVGWFFPALVYFPFTC